MAPYASPSATKKPQKKKLGKSQELQQAFTKVEDAKKEPTNLRWSIDLLPEEKPKPRHEDIQYKKRKKEKRVLKEKTIETEEKGQKTEMTWESPPKEGSIEPEGQQPIKSITVCGKSLEGRPVVPSSTNLSIAKLVNSHSIASRPLAAVPFQRVVMKQEPTISSDQHTNLSSPRRSLATAELHTPHSLPVISVRSTFSLNPHGADLHGEPTLRKTIIPQHSVSTPTLDLSSKPQNVKRYFEHPHVNHSQRSDYPYHSHRSPCPKSFTKPGRFSLAEDTAEVPRDTDSVTSSSVPRQTFQDGVLTLPASVLNEALPNATVLASKKKKQSKKKKPKHSQSALEEPENFESKPAFSINDLSPQEENGSISPKILPTIRIPSPLTIAQLIEEKRGGKKQISERTPEDTENRLGKLSIVFPVLKMSDLVQFGKRKNKEEDATTLTAEEAFDGFRKAEGEGASLVSLDAGSKDFKVNVQDASTKPTSLVSNSSIANSSVMRPPPGLTTLSRIPPGFDGPTEGPAFQMHPELGTSSPYFQLQEGTIAHQEAMTYHLHNQSLYEKHQRAGFMFAQQWHQQQAGLLPPQMLSQQQQFLHLPQHAGQYPLSQFEGYLQPVPNMPIPPFGQAQPQQAMLSMPSWPSPHPQPCLNQDSSTAFPYKSNGAQFEQYYSPLPQQYIGSWPPALPGMEASALGFQGPQVKLSPPGVVEDSPISPLFLNASPTKTFTYPFSPGPIPPQIPYYPPGPPHQQVYQQQNQSQVMPSTPVTVVASMNPQTTSHTMEPVFQQETELYGHRTPPQQTSIMRHHQPVCQLNPQKTLVTAEKQSSTNLLDQTSRGSLRHWSGSKRETKLYDWKAEDNITISNKDWKSSRNKNPYSIRGGTDSTRGGYRNSGRRDSHHNTYPRNPLGRRTLPKHADEPFFSPTASTLHTTRYPLSVHTTQPLPAPSSLSTRLTSGYKIRPPTSHIPFVNRLVQNLHAECNIPINPPKTYLKKLTVNALFKMIEADSLTLFDLKNELEYRISHHIYVSPYRMSKILTGQNVEFQILPYGWGSERHIKAIKATKAMRQEFALWATVKNFLSSLIGDERVFEDEVLEPLCDIGVRRRRASMSNEENLVAVEDRAEERKGRKEETNGRARRKSCGFVEMEMNSGGWMTI